MDKNGVKRTWGIWDATDTLIEIVSLRKLCWISEDLGLTCKELQSIINLQSDEMFCAQNHTFRLTTLIN